mmetsp:Transcript_5914/g.12128  ORF Transcript_5914/g.12128 Transcript_5914/m.12128 type:complete len:234 (+) Transcript_5914:108-809(+)
MEVLKSGDAPSLVTNLEVMQLLRERLASRSSDAGVGDCDEQPQQQQLLHPTNGSLTNTTAMGAAGGRGGPFENRDWIESTVLHYLRSSPCGEIPEENLARMGELVERLRRDPSDNGYDGGTREIAPDSNDGGNNDGDYTRAGHDNRGYGLTDAETLQILNHMPTSLVEVHLLIEDVDKRDNLKEERDQLEFLKLVSRYSGREVQGDGASAEEEEGEGKGGQDIDDDDNDAMDE